MLKPVLFLTLFTVFTQGANAADSADTNHEQDRAMLRSLLADIEGAINRNDMVYLSQYLDDDVVITHQNAHVAKGKQAFIDYNRKMTQGPDAVIKKLSTKASIGGPAFFHGDNTAIGYGTSVDDIELTSGKKFRLDVAWTATLIKANEQWKAAAIHFSTNVLDNAILDATRQTIWWIGGGLAIAGLAIGWFAGRKSIA